MSDKKILRILLIAICAALAGFLGLGIYFICIGSIGSGLFGVGSAVLGLGLFLLLGKDVIFKFEKALFSCGVDVLYQNQSYSGKISVHTDSVVLSGVSNIDLCFDRASVSCQADGESVILRDGLTNSPSYIIKFPSLIRAKAFLQFLGQKECES